jgi:ABC-2 type transport system ATP-binding protein
VSDRTVASVIELTNLTKVYGGRRVVDDLTLTVHPGRITGFLGPNGAGKSTTMRMILGLAAPTAGRATVLGRPYRDLPEPMRHVGALLDARASHPGRSARDHLRFLARTNGIDRRRVDEVLELTGLTSVADRRTGGYSLGMGQRLGIATALLGDPEVLVLDEPVNGLDTDGIRWLRRLLRDLADDGRTILLSSHLMGEMEQTADHLVVIGGGRLLADMDMRTFLASHSRGRTVVRSPHLDRLEPALRSLGGRVDPDPARPDTVLVEGVSPQAIGETAARLGVALHELSPRTESLEDVYTRLTAATVEYHSATVGHGAKVPPDAKVPPGAKVPYDTKESS